MANIEAKELDVAEKRSFDAIRSMSAPPLPTLPMASSPSSGWLYSVGMASAATLALATMGYSVHVFYGLRLSKDYQREQLNAAASHNKISKLSICAVLVFAGTLFLGRLAKLIHRRPQGIHVWLGLGLLFPLARALWANRFPVKQRFIDYSSPDTSAAEQATLMAAYTCSPRPSSSA